MISHFSLVVVLLFCCSCGGGGASTVAMSGDDADDANDTGTVAGTATDTPLADVIQFDMTTLE